MKNSWQTWFWRGSLLLIFVMALMVSLYWANGFQYDFISNQIRRTGIIDISYSDTRARVYLDGQKMEGNLPFVINNVLPGRYQLAVGREGYWDYSIDIDVAADLISRAGSVFLYPRDVLAQTKELQAWTMENGQEGRIILEGGYFWRSEDTRLLFAKLRSDFDGADLREAKGVAGRDIKSISVFGKLAHLEMADGQRYIVDLLTGESKKVNVPANYVFAGDKWYFYQANFLAALDQQLENVIWSKQPIEGQHIIALRSFTAGKRNFVALDFSPGRRDGVFYELQNNQLLPLDTGHIDSVALAANGQLHYTKDGREIWSYDFKTGKPVFLRRFENQVSLISADLLIHHSGDLLILKMKDRYLLADVNFENVQDMFNGLGVVQLQVVSPKTLYFVRYLTEQAELESTAKLYSWDLES